MITFTKVLGLNAAVCLLVCSLLSFASMEERAFTSTPQESSRAQSQKRQKKQRTTSRGSEPRPVGSSENLGFVDTHLHLNDVAMARELMAEGGIERAIVFWGRDSTNASLSEAAALYPEQFIPFYSVSPEREAYRRAWEANDLSILDEVDEALASNKFHGIGELSVTHFPSRGFPESSYGPLHPISQGLFELAEKHGVPISLHCEITHLDALSKALESFPEVTVIWAHGGYTPYFLAKRMLEAHSNLIYELSARTWRHHPRSPEYTIYADDQNVWPQWLELIEAHPHRFLVGTDAGLHSLDLSRDQVGGVQRLLEQLSEETRRMIARENIANLL